MADLRVLYHAHCFDGFASAAAFSAFYREVVQSDADIVYRGMRHGSARPLDEFVFDQPVNAIVDFRYSPSDRLHWWFDHHRSAFLDAGERQAYEARNSRQQHWDPDEPSCAGFIVRRVRTEFGVELPALDSLVQWTDMTDSAGFPDAVTAVELHEPVLQLMTVCEQLQDGVLARRLVDALADGEVESFALDHDIQRRFQAIQDEQERGRALVEQRMKVFGDTVLVDLVDAGRVTVNKFLGYYLVPDCTYVVTLLRARSGIKISVGSNPWRPLARRHDISAICRAYGGGGHAVVGGITLEGASIERGREVGREIVDRLMQTEPVS